MFALGRSLRRCRVAGLISAFRAAWHGERAHRSCPAFQAHLADLLDGQGLSWRARPPYDLEARLSWRKVRKVEHYALSVGELSPEQGSRPKGGTA